MFAEALDVLEQLEAIGTTRNPKIELLQRYAHNNILRDIFSFTYDWKFTYGVSAPVVEERLIRFEPITTRQFHEFVYLLQKLVMRLLTGDAARSELNHFLGGLDLGTRKWLLRVLDRDLQIRVSAGTINKIWPGLIREFNIQKAEEYEKGMELKFPLLVEPKLDGLRMVVRLLDGKAVAYSSSGKEMPQMQALADEVTKLVGDKEIYFDGEIMANSGWNETSSLVRTHTTNLSDDQKQRLKDNLFYNVFDVAFQDMLNPLPLHKRTEQVSNSLAQINCPNIRQVVGEVVNNLEELMESYANFLALGFEGCMIKDLNAPYGPVCSKKGKEHWRHNGWLKYKPFIDVDVEILAAYEGKSPNTIGKLGQFLVRTKEGDQFHVGSGFTFLQREEFWVHGADMIGRIIEIKMQEDEKQVAVARFPIFKRLRDDRARFSFSEDDHLHELADQKYHAQVAEAEDEIREELK